MKTYLIDANHLGTLIHARSKTLQRIDEARKNGHRFATIVPVLCEVDAGLAGRNKGKHCWALMRQEASFVRVWPLEYGLAQVFGDLFVDLRARGRALSHVDLLLASIAEMKRCTLLTTDRDFEALPDIPCENWLLP